MGKVLAFKKSEKPEQSHCTCVISPPPAAPPKKVWSAAGWVCSECGCILTRKDLIEDQP